MRIPADETERRSFIRWVLDICTASQGERRALYTKRRRYSIYGQNTNETVRFNKLQSHVALLSSFLFAPDQISFAVSPPHNSGPEDEAAFLAIEDDFNDDFTSCGLADAYDEALSWAINYDTMILKSGWNDVTGQLFVQMVEPAAFGVFEEYRNDLAGQPAMTHTFVLDYDDAVERLVRAGKASEIPRLQVFGGGSSDLGLPSVMSQMIVSATGGTNIQGPIQGEINPKYESSPSYTPRVAHSVVPFHEVWIFDTGNTDEEGKGDWRVFHVLDPDIIISDSMATIKALRNEGKHRVKPKYDSSTNLFLKRDHPFTAVTPYTLYDYFWGLCHLESLIPLQNWLNERLEQIDEILQMQVDPAKSFSGFSGLDDETAAAWGGAGTEVRDSLPGSKAELHPPQMPEDLFREFDMIQGLFMEQSGFTEIMAGRGEKNVRGRGHARELKTTGAGRVRKVATGLEKSLTRFADVSLKLKAKNDDTPLRTSAGVNFVLAQILGESDYGIRVSGHSHSPLFTMESTEIAFALQKTGAIDREWLLRLIKPPHQSDLINNLRKRVAAENQMRQQQALAGGKPNGAGAKNGAAHSAS